MALSVHVLYFYSATWHDNFLPRVGFLIAHVQCHALVHLHVTFLFDHVACSVQPCAQQSIHHKVIQDCHSCKD